MRKINVLILLLLISPASNAIVLGFVTGTDYIKMDKQNQYSWVYGTMDGIMAEDIYTKKAPEGPWLGKCISTYDFEQLKAIFEKELKSNPKNWHTPAALVLQSSLSKFCNGD